MPAKNSGIQTYDRLQPCRPVRRFLALGRLAGAGRSRVGRPPDRADEGLAILRSHDDELLDLLAASFRIRRQYFGKRVQLYFLMNAKSGLCPEDCGYCSQSKVSEAEIPRYNLLNAEKLLDARPRGRRATGQDLLHRDFGPRAVAARNGRHHEDRSRRSSRTTISRSALAWAC